MEDQMETEGNKPAWLWISAFVILGALHLADWAFKSEHNTTSLLLGVGLLASAPYGYMHRVQLRFHGPGRPRVRRDWSYWLLVLGVCLSVTGVVVRWL